MRRFGRLFAIERRRRIRLLLIGIPGCGGRFDSPFRMTVAAAGLAVTVGLGIGPHIDDAVVVLGVLEVRLCRNTIPLGQRIAREPNVLLVNLMGVAAYPALGAGAIEIALARRGTMLFALRPPARSPSV